uniref:Calcineurin-like phosphoesterase domain-containing protein n=1 Tax=Romanomermis culicivorax TaxID=13658 RepID=A0A915IF36_ROMCU
MPTENQGLAPPSTNEDKRSSRRGSLFVTSAYANSQERLVVPKSAADHHRHHGAGTKDLRRRSSPSAPVHPAKMAAALLKADTEICDKKQHQQSSALKQMFVKNPGNSNIDVNAYTHNPNEAWEWLKSSNVIWPIKIKKPPDPVPDNVARFVCMSDTHGRPLNPRNIPNGDVLIVAGDFTSCGHPQEIRTFDEFLGHLPHPYKLVVCGNHELTFHHDWAPIPTIEKMLKMDRVTAVQCVFREALKQAGVINPRQLLTNCTLLEDSGATLFDLNIFGSPW